VPSIFGVGRVVHKAPVFTLENIGIIANFPAMADWSIGYRI
jgi:hypothetical protein